MLRDLRKFFFSSKEFEWKIQKKMGKIFYWKKKSWIFVKITNKNSESKKDDFSLGLEFEFFFFKVKIFRQVNLWFFSVFFKKNDLEKKLSQILQEFLIRELSIFVDWFILFYWKSFLKQYFAIFFSFRETARRQKMFEGLFSHWNKFQFQSLRQGAFQKNSKRKIKPQRISEDY